MIPRERSTSCDRCYGDDQDGCEAGRLYGPCRTTCLGRCSYAGPCTCDCHVQSFTRHVDLAPRDLAVLRRRGPSSTNITAAAGGLYLQLIHDLQGTTTTRLPAGHHVRIEVTIYPEPPVIPPATRRPRMQLLPPTPGPR
jgi:hypothetical protein